MHKLAVFVEGYTELLFMDRLVTEIGGHHNVDVEHRQIRGGSNVPRKTFTIKAVNRDSNKNFYILLIDCGSDAQVKTRIVEEHQGLSNSGYFRVVGLRDVRPDFQYADISKLEQGLSSRIKTSLIPVEFILPVMELEAWFLAEYHHFAQIDPSLTMDRIRGLLGIDLINDDMALRSNPTDDLNKIYQLVNREYKKGCDTTINVLDYDFIYGELSLRVTQLKRLITILDSFFAL